MTAATKQASQLKSAQSLYGQGKLIAAAEICEQLIAENEANSDAWFLLACAHQRLGHLNDAIGAAQNALRLRPFEAGFYAQAGDICQEAGVVEEAEAYFRRAIALKPKFHQAYNGLGILLVDLKRLEEAVTAFRSAVDIRPDYAIAHNNLGMALMALNRLDEAAECFERAIKAKHDYAAAQKNLATLKGRQGDFATAISWLQRAIAVRPDFPEAHAELAGLYNKQGATREAFTHYREAVRLQPTNPVYLNVLAELLWERGDFDAALEMYRHTLTIAPSNLKANLCANLLLPVMPRSVEALHDSRERFIAGLERLESDLPSFLKNPPAELERDIQWDNFYLAYQGFDDRELQLRYAAIIRKTLHHLAPELFELHRRERNATERLRIGFASNNFYDCTVGQYFRSWITRLDPARFDITVYHLNASTDDVTREIQAAATAAFKPLVAQSLLRVAQTIAADELDVLIYPELGMYPLLFCLASLRLAPVQCAGWGHPVTTGHENVDYFLSCGEMEPADADNHYSEKLVRLPGLGTKYEMPTTLSRATREELGLPADKILYLIPQSLFKIHPDNDPLILDVLEAEPTAAVVMFEPEREELKRVFAERFGKQFQLRGMDPAGRIWMLPRMNRENYLRVNQLCDVMLDTLNWSGGNTSLDAIAAGLPIVTLPGKFMRGRQSFAMLKALGCDDLIARDRADYVAIALRIGRNAELRNEVSARILAGREKLFARDEPVQALAAFLLDAAKMA